MARALDLFRRRERPAPGPAALAEPLEAASFRELHVAGRPEGNPWSNKDIDPDGSDRNGLGALCRRQAFAERRRCAGITLPVHAGTADPARPDWPIRFTGQLRAAPSAATA